jgi:hypothetical protein
MSFNKHGAGGFQKVYQRASSSQAFGVVHSAWRNTRCVTHRNWIKALAHIISFSACADFLFCCSFFFYRRGKLLVYYSGCDDLESWFEADSEKTQLECLENADG